MNKTSTTIGILILIIGFLTSCTVYYYSKTRTSSKISSSDLGTVDSSAVVDSTPVSSRVNELTKPAEAKGRLSYPANVYTLQTKETLAGLSAKLGVPWTMIKKANSITDENKIQAGQALVIPIYNTQTDYYRINFLINSDKATELNIEVRDQTSSDYFDPVKVAKLSAVNYFEITDTDQFSLLEADLSQGIAYVQVKNGNIVNIVGLIQPKIKGKNGLWAVQYIERKQS